MTPQDTIIPTEDEKNLPGETNVIRRFPALPQLLILSVLLLLLLGSAGTTYILKSHSTNKTAWVEILPESTNQPTATLTTSEIKPLKDIDIEAKAGFVYDVVNNRVLYQKSADVALPIASITKLMTTLVAHELLTDDATVAVPLSATQQESASGLRAGERLTVKALSEFAMIASSNDAAYSLATAGANAITGSPSEALFVEAMNIRAKELGFNSMSFSNVHGLDVSPTKAGAYASAREVSFLLNYIYKTYPELLSITTEEDTRIYNTSGEYHDAENTNRALKQIPQLRGSKTGYTTLAGGNLTVVFDAGFNRPIIVTVLGSSFSGRFTDVMTLIEATQAQIITASE